MESKMKVLFDHQIFEQQVIGGISRYFDEIITYSDGNFSNCISIKYSNNQYLQKRTYLNINPLLNYRTEFLKGFEFKGKGRLFSLVKYLHKSAYPEHHTINKQYAIESLLMQDFDVFHPTYYDPYFLEYLGNKPFVLTIHDMIHEIYPEFQSSIYEISFIRNKSMLAQKAAHIIAVSENTKNDIIEILGISENKISVIPHATSITLGSPTMITVPELYFLYIGDRKGAYKNFKFMIYSIAPILREHPKLKLICTGEDFSDNEKYLFESLDISDRVISLFVNDTDISTLYSNALSLIFPSYYEGFGLPVVEAFKCNCPVILANTNCFQEVAGDAAIYFEPKSAGSLQKKILEVLNNKEIRSKYIRLGQKQVEKYSWHNSAHKTYEVYKSVVS